LCGVCGVRYEEEIATLTTRVGEAEAQVEQLMRLKVRKAYPHDTHL
jgi:hypothetical protein